MIKELKVKQTTVKMSPTFSMEAFNLTSTIAGYRIMKLKDITIYLKMVAKKILQKKALLKKY